VNVEDLSLIASTKKSYVDVVRYWWYWQ